MEGNGLDFLFSDENTFFFCQFVWRWAKEEKNKERGGVDIGGAESRGMNGWMDGWIPVDYIHVCVEELLIVFSAYASNAL